MMRTQAYAKRSGAMPSRELSAAAVSPDASASPIERSSSESSIRGPRREPQAMSRSAAVHATRRLFVSTSASATPRPLSRRDDRSICPPSQASSARGDTRTHRALDRSRELSVGCRRAEAIRRGRRFAEFSPARNTTVLGFVNTRACVSLPFAPIATPAGQSRLLLWNYTRGPRHPVATAPFVDAGIRRTFIHIAHANALSIERADALPVSASARRLAPCAAAQRRTLAMLRRPDAAEPSCTRSPHECAHLRTPSRLSDPSRSFFPHQSRLAPDARSHRRLSAGRPNRRRSSGHSSFPRVRSPQVRGVSEMPDANRLRPDGTFADPRTGKIAVDITSPGCRQVISRQGSDGVAQIDSYNLDANTRQTPGAIADVVAAVGGSAAGSASDCGRVGPVDSDLQFATLTYHPGVQGTGETPNLAARGFESAAWVAAVVGAPRAEARR